MTKETQIDKYKKALLEKLETLKRCQQEKSIDSCLKCNEIIGCKTRNEYVNAVYESMNKGEGGGFEF